MDRRYFVDAAQTAQNFSELCVLLGKLAIARRLAVVAVRCVEQVDQPRVRLEKIMVLGSIYHQMGMDDQALRSFEHAKDVCSDNFLAKFYLNDFVLAENERCAWRCALTHQREESIFCDTSAYFKSAQYRSAGANPAEVAFTQLTAGRGAFYETICRSMYDRLPSIKATLDSAVQAFRNAGEVDELPRGLLTRAWCSVAVAGQLRSAGHREQAREFEEDAERDLNEAWEIAERGPMRLVMADIHLHRARLFFREKRYPWGSPAADLVAAEELMNDCGYHRRYRELADAKEAVIGR